MAEESQDSSQKTEEPTQKRLEDARNRGQVPHSKEVTNFVMLLAATILIALVFPGIIKSSILNIKSYVVDVHNFNHDYDADDVFRLFLKITGEIAALIILPFVAAIFTGIMGSILQHGIIYAPEVIEPKLSKLSPLAGIKRIISIKTLVELFKSLIRISVITATVWLVIKFDIPAMMHMHDLDLGVSIAYFSKIIVKALISICFMQFIIAIIDFLYEKHLYLQNLRMTKQEVKDEHKQMEGDPLIKSKIRTIRLEKSKRRIAILVPEATVLITNPTHISIALLYNDELPAPKVIAKGQDAIALQMRQIAKKNSIPIVENKALARSIYTAVDWDEFIKPEHFKAVAKIMTKLRNV